MIGMEPVAPCNSESLLLSINMIALPGGAVLEQLGSTVEEDEQG